MMIPWMQVFAILLWDSKLSSARPSDIEPCNARAYRTSQGEPISVGCPPGKLYAKPWDPMKIDAKYEFYERANQSAASYILPWNHSFKGDDGPRCDGDERVFLIIHGYTEGPNETWIDSLSNAYFDRLAQRSKVIVIRADWAKAARGELDASQGGITGTINYLLNLVQAASNVQMTGRITAEFLARWMLSCNLSENALHLLGHSFGGEVLGEVAYWLNTKLGIKPGRVSAMDPAMVLFPKEEILLSRSDAHFLEVVHSSATPTIIGALFGAVGVYWGVGHADLFPNGGTIVQPACRNGGAFLCSHHQGHYYYERMLDQCNETCDFEGERCATEWQAVLRGSRCTEGKIPQVWKYLNERADHYRRVPSEGNAVDRSDIIYFATDGDRLITTCQ